MNDIIKKHHLIHLPVDHGRWRIVWFVSVSGHRDPRWWCVELDPSRTCQTHQWFAADGCYLTLPHELVARMTISVIVTNSLVVLHRATACEITVFAVRTHKRFRTVFCLPNPGWRTVGKNKLLFEHLLEVLKEQLLKISVNNFSSKRLNCFSVFERRS